MQPLEEPTVFHLSNRSSAITLPPRDALRVNSRQGVSQQRNARGSSSSLLFVIIWSHVPLCSMDLPYPHCGGHHEHGGLHQEPGKQLPFVWKRESRELEKFPLVR